MENLKVVTIIQGYFIGNALIVVLYMYKPRHNFLLSVFSQTKLVNHICRSVTITQKTTVFVHAYLKFNELISFSCFKICFSVKPDPCARHPDSSHRVLKHSTVCGPK